MGSHQENVPHHPKPEVVYDLPLNLQGLESAFAHCVEFASREIVLVQGGTCTVCWLDGLVKSERLNDYVLRPLITGPVPAEVQKVGGLLQGVIWNLNVQTQTTVDETVAAMVDGSCAVVLPDGVLTCSVPTEEKRSVEGPENETEAKGARDSFVESVRTSTSLVRRRLKSAKVKCEEYRVGRTSQTAVDVLWVEDITNQTLVDKISQRIADMDIDALLAASDIEEYLVDSRSTVFPQVLFTERPDRFCRGLMDGRVGVLIDGIPLGCLVPCDLNQFLRTSQDLSYHWAIVSVLTLLRYLSIFITVLLPGFYIAVSAFHLQMIPTQLALSIIASKQDVPFSTQFEVLVMLLAFELLQEAGLRMPKTIGQSVSIIGTLVVGQAAVEAKIVSPAVIIVVAAAGMAGFTMPSQDFANGLRIWRFLVALGACFAGLFGLTTVVAALIFQLAKMQNCGVSYLTPFMAKEWQHKGGGWVVRGPMPDIKLRDLSLNPEGKRRQK